MAAKLPWFKFFPDDWLSDEKLRACSLEARGLWIDILALAHKNDRRGYLQLNGKPVTAEQLARMAACSPDEASRALGELQAAGVPSVQSDGIVYSRRMVRDEHIGRERSKAGRKGAEVTNGGLPRQKSGKPPGKGPAPPPAQESESESEPESESGDESPHPSCPETRQAASSVPQAGAREEPVLLFPTDGRQKEWALTPSELAELSSLFPSLDVLAECRKALAWVLATPSRRKTSGGMRRFLTGWLSRSQDRGPPRSPAGPPRRPGDETLAERIARIQRERQCPQRPGRSGPNTTPPSSG